MSFIVLLLVGGLIASIIANSRRRGPSSDKELAEMRERMARLEQTVETMSADIERFSEGQRFLTSLLEERPKGQAAIKPPSPVPPVPPVQPVPPVPPVPPDA